MRDHHPRALDGRFTSSTNTNTHTHSHKHTFLSHSHSHYTQCSTGPVQWLVCMMPERETREIGGTLRVHGTHHSMPCQHDTTAMTRHPSWNTHIMSPVMGVLATAHQLQLLGTVSIINGAPQRVKQCVLRHTRKVNIYSCCRQ